MKFRVILTEAKIVEVVVEAESEERARELALRGTGIEVEDYEVKDTAREVWKVNRIHPAVGMTKGA